MSPDESRLLQLQRLLLSTTARTRALQTLSRVAVYQRPLGVAGGHTRGGCCKHFVADFPRIKPAFVVAGPMGAWQGGADAVDDFAAHGCTLTAPRAPDKG